MSSTYRFPNARDFVSHARSGFTLIELLIVIAIILILIAIALPNFLEAQLRAKVTRVQADMRALGTAMEAYQIQFGMYPLPWDNGPNTYPTTGIYATHLTIIIALTTPIPYIGQPKMHNPFLDGSTPLSKFYQFGTGDRKGDRETPDKNFARLGNIRAGRWDEAFGSDAWIIASEGPNSGRGGNRGDEVFRLVRYPTGTTGTTYSATNGTGSIGDIFRFGPSGYKPQFFEVTR